MRLVSILIFCCFAAGGHSQDVLITHINIIDVVNKEILYDKTVLIANKKIQRISNASFRAEKATELAGSGRFLLPGLWDMHVHTVDSSYLKMFVVNGVTGIRDMGGAAANANNGCESIQHERLMQWRNMITAGTMIGPRMLISGPPVSNTGWPTSININSSDQGRAAVSRLKKEDVDFIKIYEAIPLEAYQALAAAAKTSGLTIAGHVPETVSLLQASDAGQRSIEHIRDALLICFTNNREELLRFFYEDNWSQADIDWGLQRFNESSKVIEAFKRNETWLVPTLTVEWSKVAVRDEGFVDDSNRRKLPPAVSQEFKNYVTRKLKLSAKDRKSDSLWWATQKRLVQRMHKEGIPLLAGTDCACQGGIPGSSLHKELQLLVEAGLTTFEALQTATINPAKFLKMTDPLGTVAEGKVADLVILDRNPIEDISATQSIFAVIVNGRLLTAESIRMLKGTLAPSK